MRAASATARMSSHGAQRRNSLGRRKLKHLAFADVGASMSSSWAVAALALQLLILPPRHDAAAAAAVLKQPQQQQAPSVLFILADVRHTLRVMSTAHL